MKTLFRRGKAANTAGLTLLEMTLVVAVLLGLISVTFIGFAAYREGSNRAMCITNVASAQQAMRSFCNIYQIEPGDPRPDLRSRLVGAGRMISIEPACPSGGSYTYATDVSPGTVPAIGTALLRCSITPHLPSSTDGW